MSSLLPQSVSGDVQLEAATRTLVLPTRFVGTLAKATATPSVLNAERWIAANTLAQNVTDFLNGQPGQELKILGDGFTTIVDGAPIKTNTAANKLLAANKVYTLTRFGSVWVEDA